MFSAFALALCMQAGSADRATIKVESSVELDIVVRDGNGEAKKLLNVSRKDAYRQDRVDARSMRIKVLSSRLQRSGTDTPLEERDTALAGKTYTATRTEAGWAVLDDKGGVAPVDGANLGAWNDLVRLLPPGGSVKAGAKWSLESKDLLPFLYPHGLHETEGKLELSCQSVEGSRANVSLTGTVSGKGSADNTKVVLQIKSGTLVYDTGVNRPVSLLISAVLESTTDMVDLVRKPNTNEEERRKVGEVTLKSRRFDTALTVE
jgi:hypothetical protein